MKIAVYGAGKVAERFCRRCENAGESMDIVYFVQTEKTMDHFQGKKVIAAQEIDYSQFDNLIIASDKYFDEILSFLKKLDKGFELYKDKIMRYSDLYLRRWENARTVMPYISCKVCKDIVYITTSEDRAIAMPMIKTGYNFSENLIKAFFSMTAQYYGTKGVAKGFNGYFLDIGANIGTTSIYVKKKINHNLHIIGFEPGKSNYDLFRVNCILNQTEDIKAEPFGLSNTNTTKKYWYNVTNSGGSSLTGDESEGENISTVNVMKLDDYLNGNKISPYDIEYIWMDAEGHESYILEGAMETLTAKKIPLLQESSPISYYKQGRLEKYCNSIAQIYDGFIDVHEYINGQINPMPIAQIHDFAMRMIKENKIATDLFFY